MGGYGFYVLSVETQISAEDVVRGENAVCYDMVTVYERVHNPMAESVSKKR